VQQFDCELKGTPISMKKAKKEIKVQGRGGTCFQPLIDFFTTNSKIYDGLIIFTDGYAEVPQNKPATARKILWICNNEQSYKQHLEWMRTMGRCCWIKE
jgi:predicted metal-dependent peptidase